jgi:hypothetical protein
MVYFTFSFFFYLGWLIAVVTNTYAGQEYTIGEHEHNNGTGDRIIFRLHPYYGIFVEDIFLVWVNLLLSPHLALTLV